MVGGQVQRQQQEEADAFLMKGRSLWPSMYGSPDSTFCLIDRDKRARVLLRVTTGILLTLFAALPPDVALLRGGCRHLAPPTPTSGRLDVTLKPRRRRARALLPVGQPTGFHRRLYGNVVRRLPTLRCDTSSSRYAPRSGRGKSKSWPRRRVILGGYGTQSRDLLSCLHIAKTQTPSSGPPLRQV